MFRRISLLILAVFCSSWTLQAQANRTLSDAILFESQGLYREALEKLEQIENDFGNCTESLDYFLLKAEALIKLGELETAEELLAGIPSCDNDGLARIKIAKGNLLLNYGLYDQSIDELQSALSILQKDTVTNRSEIICMSGLASANLTVGNYNRAEQIGQAALNLAERWFGQSDPLYAATLNDLGLILFNQNPKEAYKYYLNALEIYQQIFPPEHPKLAISFTNLGVCDIALSRYDSALTNFQSARRIWDQIYREGHPNLALVIRNMGRAYEKRNEKDTAIVYFQQSLNIYRSSLGETHPEVASTYNDLSALYLKNQDFELALATLEKAIDANTVTNPSDDQIPYYNALVALSTLSLKAQILYANYQQRSLRMNDLRDAIATVDSCHLLIQEIRRAALSEEDKLRINSLASDVYETGVAISITMGDNSLISETFYEKSFFYAEQSKSTVLQGLIADSKAKQFGGIPDQLLNRETEIKSEITSITQRLSQKPDSELERVLQVRLFEAERELQSLIDKMEIEYPSYYDLKYNQSSPTVAQLQEKLGPESVLLSYFVSEKGQDLYTFVITSSNFKVRITPLDSEFEKTLNQFTNSLVFNIPYDFNQSSRNLYKILIPPLPLSTDEIIVVPYGRLSTIPFETLLTKSTRRTDYSKNDYLIDKWAISYAFSINFVNQATSVSLDDAKILLMAPVQFDDYERWLPLPGSEIESNTIGDLFGERATSFIKKAAEEEQLKQLEIRDYNFVHLATHGEVNEEEPGLSRIILNPSETEDGNLYADEIYNLSLEADLITLSACETGLGKISRGEGLLGLSRALIYSGAKNIIVSYWSVSDQSTAELMTSFYKNISSGSRFSIALQQAKQEIKMNSSYEAPYYWAPFILNGR